MTEVVIAGIGQTAVGEHWDVSLRELAFNAIEAAVKDAGGLRPQSLFVANMLAPQLSQQAHLGVLVADFAGLNGIEAYTIESGNASGGAALRMAYLALQSGQVDVALVVGVEKFTDQVGSRIDTALASTSDSDYEAIQGITPTAQAALLMARYMHEYNPARESFGHFPITAHANGVHNPNAMFRRAIRAEVYNRASMVSAPLNMFDAAPYADGAAAVVLTRPDILPPDFPHPLVRITGSALATDTLSLHDRPEPLVFHAAKLSAKKALQQARISREQVDFFELHDSFSIYAALSLEAAGFAPAGGAWQLAQDGAISREGSIPIATLGGLKARGNPGGATGVYQAVEAVNQLRHNAGEGQIDGARCALIQCLGGPASSAATHVLQVI